MTINASAIWRVRPGGNALNGAGFDPGISSPGTDFSQQNSPQATFNGTSVTASNGAAGATITLTGYTVTAADVANCLQIASGTNFTAGWYFITSVNTGSNTWTLDRNCTTGAGAAMVGRMGGAAGGATAHPFELARSGSGPAVPGNRIRILGSSATPSTPDYSFANNFLNPQTSGSITVGPIIFEVDDSQPTWRPYISNSGGDLFIANSNSNAVFNGLIFRPTSVGNGRMFDGGSNWFFINCTWNMNDIDTNGVNASGATTFLNDEFYSKLGSAPVARTSTAINATGTTISVLGCNFHDLGVIPILTNRAISAFDNIFSNNVVACIVMNGANSFFNNSVIRRNTFNGKTSSGADGIQVTTNEMLAGLAILDNIFSNFATAAKSAINISANSSSATLNDRIKMFRDFNDYYNNSTNITGGTIGANDLTLDPQYTSAPTDLTLSGTNLQAQAFPRTAIIGG